MQLSDKTVGEHSINLMEKPDTQQSVVETQREILKTYMKDIEKCFEDGVKAGFKGDFYIVVHKRRERTLVNVIRQQFQARQTRPAPAFDNDVWKANAESGDLFYCWSLPDLNTYNEILWEPEKYRRESPELVEMCLRHFNGELK